jgi:two-component system NtrC family sensor kinase
MNIRWKVGLLIATLLLVLGITEVCVADRVLIPSFTELERTEADVAMRRVEYALARASEQLSLSTLSWGNWADTYRFARDHNRSFVNENVTVIGLKELDVNAIAILDVNNQVIASGALDGDSDQPLNADILGKAGAATTFPWREKLRAGRVGSGLLQTDRGLLQVAAAPIRDGFGRGPARGMVIMGRLLSVSQINELAAQAQAKLAVLPPASSGEKGKRIVESKTTTSVYETMADIYGQPAVTLRVDVPREITRRGRSAVNYATACLMGAAAIVVILLILILNRVVLSPLARVTRHAVTIGENADLTNRLDFVRKDEIGVLAREFDRMVARVAESRSQLVDRSFEAGYAEVARGVLHNLGNAMTPISVRLAVLQKRLRAIDSEVLGLAAEEISGAELDPARRADLGELLRLAGGSIAQTVHAAEQDVDIITRQTSIVQSALSEQMHFTRNEHVWEIVRLTDLVAQSIEVVPDEARRRLQFQADDSLSSVGCVYVPRTLLRLVLQNLIINAADAVREAGRSLGFLRLVAHLDRTGDREHLLLHCTDNGVGIEADCLQRIFENGFSTKSKATNFGIGLHWCANALGALGGRVWATSEGVGRGASIHVLLPLKALDERVSASARAA